MAALGSAGDDMIRVHLVPGVGFADAVVARVGIFSMVGDGSGAGRPRVLSSLRRTIVGGARQRRGRMIRVYLVRGVGLANAVVARVGIFSMVGDGSGAGRPPVLSSLRRTIVGGARQRRGRMIRVYLVPGVGFANAVVARVGIFSMVGGESGAGRPPVLSSLRRTIVGGARQRRGRMIRVYLVPAVGFANAVVARIGIFSMVGGESGAGRPPVLSSLRRDYRWRRSAAQGTNDQGGSCSRRGSSPTPSWPELESFPWSAARAAPGGPRS